MAVYIASYERYDGHVGTNQQTNPGGEAATNSFTRTKKEARQEALFWD